MNWRAERRQRQIARLLRLSPRERPNRERYLRHADVRAFVAREGPCPTDLVARAFGVSRRHAQTALRRMERRGEVECVGRHGRRWRATLPEAGVRPNAG